MTPRLVEGVSLLQPHSVARKATSEAMETIASFMKDYQSGLFTKSETVSRIIGLAKTLDPMTFMPDVPAEYSEEIRMLPHVIDPPQSPELILMASGMMCGPAGFVSEEFAKARHEAFIAFHALHRYFYRPT